MNKIIFFFFPFLFIINYLQSQNSIIENLQTDFTSLEGAGVITIEADSSIMKLDEFFNYETDSIKNQKDERFSKFYIQIFMNNISTHLEALSKQTIVKKKNPNLSIYLIYEYPNWKLLVGSFVTWKDAFFYKKKLQQEFLEFEKEIHIIIIDSINFLN